MKFFNIISLFGLLSTGAFLYVVYKKIIRKIISSCQEINPRKILIVTNSVEWAEAWTLIKIDLSKLSVLGFDCEWVNENKISKPVSLIQLATSSGICILIRLHLFTPISENLPISLIEVLRDKRILKVGVATLDDAKKLFNQYGIKCNGCVDLRHVFQRIKSSREDPGGLQYLAKEILGVNLDKNWRLRCSNWEAENFNEKQLEYAAKYALVAFLIFIALLNEKIKTNTNNIDSEFVISTCVGIIDVAFKINKESSSTDKKMNKSSKNHVNITKNSRAYCIRKSPLYLNSRLYSQDGQMLCTCDNKKAQWYLEKGLGTIFNEDPLYVKLNFEPSGRPSSELNYYLQEKKNICVVCGVDETYIRKNIVPHEYRKHFPANLKEHKSHDIVLLCTKCHMNSNLYDFQLKESLAIKYKASLQIPKFVQNTDIFKVKSAAKALILNENKIPIERRKLLENVIMDYFSIDHIEPQNLKEAINLDPKIENDKFEEHGSKVANSILKEGSLKEFEKMWRHHFLDCMKPMFMPYLWSVDHGYDDSECSTSQ